MWVGLAFLNWEFRPVMPVQVIASALLAKMSVKDFPGERQNSAGHVGEGSPSHF